MIKFTRMAESARIESDWVAKSQIDFTVDDERSLTELCDEFLNFLRACGYQIESDECLVFDRKCNDSDIPEEALEPSQVDLAE